MKILFICHRFPFPPNRGGKIRPFQMIRHLSQKHSVVVASLAHTQQELEEGAGLKQHCEATIAEVLPSSSRWLHAFGEVLSGAPASAAYFWSPRLNWRIQEAWGAQKFDAVMVHCAFVAQYAMNLQGGFRILDFGDMDSAKWFDYARFRGFPLNLAYKVEALKLRRFEKKAAQFFDRCTVTTRGEYEEYQTMGVPISCTVIPNGVDAEYFQARSSLPPASAAPVIVFLGRMDYFPNVDGISGFARDSFPQIRARIPNAELRIVGSNPNGHVRSLGQIGGVKVTGRVPDVRPHLADATVAIAPLRIARGTQNKILECMAAGVPVVSSQEAARGIQASPWKHFLVAEDADTFARQVVELIQNRELQTRLAAAGRRQVQTTHVWGESLKVLDNLLETRGSTLSDLVTSG
jgi:sugar transferase (PEP-CTERM/EpsH1 system associated)